MKRILIKIFAFALVFLAIVLCAILTVVDRSPYQEQYFYQEMDQRLDSLSEHYKPNKDSSRLQVGWSTVNITPTSPVPLAGYGARDPKEMEGVMDSSYIRTLIFQRGKEKIALITADLLIVHPELRNMVYQRLPDHWTPDELYFTATHTHSGQGGWAPGLVGELFAGQFENALIEYLSSAMIKSIMLAEQSMAPGHLAVGELSADHLVRNRLVKDKGIIDPWFKALMIQKDSLKALFTSFSAHATCFGPDNHDLSGDYPAYFNELLEDDEQFGFTAFSAGAVGSMAANTGSDDSRTNAQTMAIQLKEQLDLLLMIGLSWQTDLTLDAFKLKLPLRSPYFKVSTDLALRPYLFNAAFGKYEHDVSVMILGKAIFVGLPCDFSGELAVLLYAQAREMGYQLFITSFNGGYAGYVIKDEWYDLKKYEARTMSWYGPDMGSYLSEIVSRILLTIHENN